MCNNGVNHAQLQMAIEMAEAQVALVGSWMKEITHLADHADLAGKELKAAESDLKSARRALEDAVDAVKSAPAVSGFEVEVV